jgi:hypothetical protein
VGSSHSVFNTSCVARDRGSSQEGKVAVRATPGWVWESTGVHGAFGRGAPVREWCASENSEQAAGEEAEAGRGGSSESK